MNFSNFDYIFENMKPRNRQEQEILKKLLSELGEFASVKETAAKLKVSKTFIYSMIDEGNLIFIEAGRRKIIYTRSLIAVLR